MKTIKKIRQIVDFANEYDMDTRELYQNILLVQIGTINEFSINDYSYRFIHTTAIDKIQQDELLSDLYMLGMFNAEFISDQTGIEYEVIRDLQTNEQWYAIGLLMKPHIEAIQEGYKDADGYGHHFAHYDSETIEDLENMSMLVFRVN